MAYANLPVDIGPESKRLTKEIPLAVRDRILQVQSIRGSNRNDEHCQLDASNDLEAIACWLRAVGSRSEATHRRYRSEAIRFVTWLSIDRTISLSDVRARDLESYKSFLSDPQPKSLWCAPKEEGGLALIKDGLANRSINHCMTILGGLFRFLSDTAYLKGTPFAGMERAKYIAKDILGREHLSNAPTINDREVNEDWLKAIWRGLNDESTDLEQTERQRLKWIFILLSMTGMRRAEARFTPMNAFRNTEFGWVVTVVGKGQKMRNIPCPNPVIAELMAYRKSLGLSPLPSPTDDSASVRNSYGSPEYANESNIYRAVKKLVDIGVNKLVQEGKEVEAAGLEKFSPHLFRRRYVTKLIRDGAELTQVQELVGHENITTTQLYVTNHIGRASEMVNRSFNEKTFDS